MFELRYSKRHVHNRFMRYRWAMTKQSSFCGCLKVLTNFVFFQFHHYQNSHYQLPFGRNNNFLSMHSHVDKLFFVLVVFFAASLFRVLKGVHWKNFHEVDREPSSRLSTIRQCEMDFTRSAPQLVNKPNILFSGPSGCIGPIVQISYFYIASGAIYKIWYTVVLQRKGELLALNVIASFL